MFDIFFEALAGLLSFFYELVPNYALTIVMLTITVMLVVFPLTAKSTRSMLAMRKIQPELKKLQQRHKGDRAKVQQETMALYREHGVNPLSGCLPILLQAPIFIVLYQVISGLEKKPPKYISSSSSLYEDLQRSGGEVVSFGVDLAKSATDTHSSMLTALPFYALIIIMVAIQYIQMQQMSNRNPSAQNPQAQQMQVLSKIFPFIFGAMSLGFPAGVVLYWSVSSLFRVGQQWAMYRYDPALQEITEDVKHEIEAKVHEKSKKSKRVTDKKSKNKKRNRKDH